MFNFFKDVSELNKCAKIFTALYLLIDDFQTQPVQFLNIAKTEYQIYELAYIAQKGVLDRIDKNKWPLAYEIYVPAISKNRITLAFAINQTVTKVVHIANKYGFSSEVEDIFSKGKLFYQVENVIPQEIKKKL